MTLLMVTDECTPPGYVKLQLVQGNAPVLVNNYQNEIFILDSKRRSVLSNNTTFTKLPIAYEYHGPALYATGIPALYTSCWPEKTSRCLSSRRRQQNWPTRQMIDVIQKTGTLLVPVAHKLSPEQHLEWRLAFSFGEKLLTWKFNSTQYKCYVMLKFIKNTFINVDATENVLTSYHCKTCMFYVIEKTSVSLWHPYNLLLCIDLCLRQLLSWIDCNNFLNYFIPDENMFLGRNLGPVQRRISGILIDLLMQKGTYIKTIAYESIGENVVRVLGNHLASRSLEEEIPDQEKLDIAHELLLWGSSSDVGSGNLKLAAFYLCQSNLNRMEEMPNHVDAKLTHNVWEIGINYLEESMLSMILHEKLPITKIVQHHVALPVCYSSLDIYSVPKVLNFEMFCSTGCESGCDRLITHWIPTAAVTARLYLYFLQYQCFHMRGRIIPRSVALNNMI
ncbi:hypothetical protein CHS0354_007601 [Potamilus streckersoni]|uniref:Mab-21-like HhH/H2TH-like domain-containing protein n=1 Tax=Potamilus streckersoni TaxID=2493646 RepID=A0AAE0W7P6_9BIVA|nr:hypothetical protein CHS0354_007601 [Potamilus streckersoni]